jgi:hypothetical protein
MLHGAKWCGRAGRAVRWFAARDRLTTLRHFGGGPLSLRLRRGGRDGRTKLRGAKRCGRAGPAVMWFAAHDRLTALRDFGGGPLGLWLRRGGRDSVTMLHCTR